MTATTNGRTAPWPPLSRLAAEVRLVPARVDVSGVDGAYTDPDMLREAAGLLLRHAERLEAERGVR